MERTTISRRLGSLERNLGVKLLDRTPKHIAVTDAGRRCLEQCEMLLESAQNAESLAIDGVALTGSAPIVVGAPADIINRYLESVLNSFESENPGLQIERRPITYWNEDAIAAVDIGIALAPVTIGNAWTNTIGSVRQSVFASAEYAARHAQVRSVHDFESHDCIVEGTEGNCHSWRFGINGDATTVSVRAKYVVSGLLEAREATLAGLGICRLPQHLCESYLRAGRLVDLAPDIESAGRDVIAINSRQPRRKAGTGSLRSHLESAFTKD
jgi:DNA-binding transcriptional LysR family regulator